MKRITIDLQGTPPKWAKEARWYYENTFREQWIASVLSVTNELIKWREKDIECL
ncbi:MULTISPECIES: hypothetical protein [Bacillus]|uniref:hypothetical protein n=1 Tax=Bacillus TaxID=1386 RepID=UPI0002DF47A0|nr:MULTISPECIES: hypothetical protein [Bacillus]